MRRWPRLRSLRSGWVCFAALGLLGAPGLAVAQATTVFPGGSLTALRAISPSLSFGNLVIDGRLEIDLSTDASAGQVVIHASRFEITSRGSIVGDQSACSYLRGPDLTIDASGEVLLDGYIDLSGKGGDRETSSLSPALCPETTCNQCFGADAGDLTLRGQTIRIRGTSGFYDLNVNGGWGSTLEFVEYDGVNFLCRTYARMGCSGGDGGRIRLQATSRIDLEGAEFELGGGDGGTGTPEGTPGALAELEWSAPLVAVQEIEPNGSVDVDPPLFPGRAQPLGAAPVRVQGFVSYSDDSGDPDAITVTFAPPASNDRLEDLYVLFVPDTAPIGIELQAASAQRDLDLYLIDPFAFSILAESNAPPGQVERIDRTLARGWYLVGASWCCDNQILPAPPGTSYELRVLAAPEPTGAALGGSAALALSIVARRRRLSGVGRRGP